MARETFGHTLIKSSIFGPRNMAKKGDCLGYKCSCDCGSDYRYSYCYFLPLPLHRNINCRLPWTTRTYFKDLKHPRTTERFKFSTYSSASLSVALSRAIFYSEHGVTPSQQPRPKVLLFRTKYSSHYRLRNALCVVCTMPRSRNVQYDSTNFRFHSVDGISNELEGKFP